MPVAFAEGGPSGYDPEYQRLAFSEDIPARFFEEGKCDGVSIVEGSAGVAAILAGAIASERCNLAPGEGHPHGVLLAKLELVHMSPLWLVEERCGGRRVFDNAVPASGGLVENLSSVTAERDARSRRLANNAIFTKADTIIAAHNWVFQNTRSY